jgi:4-alpha-glucanotransferase
MLALLMRRQAGVVLPLSSIRTRRDWGIGQVTDLPRCAAWIGTAGHRLLQILPPHELSGGETSPYGALTAFGIDPIYTDVDAVEDLDPAAIDAALGDEGKRELERVRQAERVLYEPVRELKTRALHAAFERFHAREWLRGTPRATRLADFIRLEHDWLDDLALYGALRRAHGGWGWQTWPEDDRDRAPLAMERARKEHAKDLLEAAYVQWTIQMQWEVAHQGMRELGVELMGDVPFVVCGESADTWAHASQFQLRLSLGAPPDDFSADGQDWGLPPYDWLAMEGDNLAWLRARTRRAARLYDRFRMDHLVGYFRQWVRHPGGTDRGRFDPDGTEAQAAHGRRALGAILAELSRMPGGVEPSRALAEDLGVIPPFVRTAMLDLRLPGYRVLPWEKGEDGQFRDPRAFPRDSVAAWSTHDTAPIDAWWPELPALDRAQLAERAGLPVDDDEKAGAGERRSMALLADLYGASSDLALVLAQELLGSGGRINTPATVSAQNWTWRLPRPIEDLTGDPRVAARLEAIRVLVRASGR